MNTNYNNVFVLNAVNYANGSIVAGKLIRVLKVISIIRAPNQPHSFFTRT